MKLIKEGELVDLYAIVHENAEFYAGKGLHRTIGFSVIQKEGTEVGNFHLAPMPGCCGMVVSTGLYIKEGFRGTPESREFMEMKEWLPEWLGYSAVIATVQLENIAELKSSAKRQYKIIANWNNNRTGNELGIIFKRTRI